MAGIDDPIEAAERQIRLTEATIPDKAIDLVTEAAGLLPNGAGIGIVNAIRKFFSRESAIENLNYLLRTTIQVVRKHEKNFGELNERINSPAFVETVAVAANETVRTTDRRKIARFGAILGGQLSSDTSTSDAWEEARAHIRALSQLGERDIEALGLLEEIQGPLVPRRLDSATPTDVLDPNFFTERYSELVVLLRKRGISREEFFSRCGKLTGFGLTLEVQRNNGRMSPSDHCYRLTMNGTRLIDMLRGLGEET